MTRDPQSGPDLAAAGAVAADAPAPPLEPDATIELLLAPEDVVPLSRLPGMVRVAAARPARLLWYDDAEASLARDNLTLLRDGAAWRLERLQPGDGVDWPACSPPATLSAANAPAGLAPTPPLDIAPVAAFEGRRRAYRAGAVEVSVLHGTLRGVADAMPACRLTLSGPAAALGETLPVLAGLRAAVPRAGLAREALAVARGGPLPARHLGAPALEAGVPVSDGLATIVGHLLDALLFWTDEFRRDRRPETIHQARVATRRLRSALSLYKRVAACPELQASGLALKTCATVLGAARDWDVFIAGTGAQLGAQLGAKLGTHQSDSVSGDRRIAALLRAASRRRGEAYAELAAYLASPQFRQLELELGVASVLRPWERGRDPAALRTPTAPFAGEVLARRMTHVRHRGRGLQSLAIPELHEPRKDCKRLRYAAEFFAPAFPAKQTKPFLRRLADLQEGLGALNDSAAAAQLMGQLGRAGRGYAGGVVEGFATAAATPARDHIIKSWKRFRDTTPFWKS